MKTNETGAEHSTKRHEKCTKMEPKVDAKSSRRRGGVCGTIREAQNLVAQSFACRFGIHFGTSSSPKARSTFEKTLKIQCTQTLNFEAKQDPKMMPKRYRKQQIF